MITEGEYVLMSMMMMFLIAFIAIIFTCWMYRD